MRAPRVAATMIVSPGCRVRFSNGRQERMFAALDEPDRHVLQRREEAGDRRTADEGMAEGDVDLGDELLAAAARHLLDHAAAGRQEPGKDEGDIAEADEGHRRRRHGEIEEADAETVFRGDAGGQQVGRGADEGGDAAEECGEAQRHQGLGGGDAARGGDRGDDRQEHHHDRGVVDHRTRHHGGEEDEDDGPHLALAAEAGEEGGRALERVGLVEPLADDDHRQDGDQRLVGKSGEDRVGAERALDADDLRDKGEEQQPADDRSDRHHLDRPLLERIGGDHGENAGEGQPHQDVVAGHLAPAAANGGRSRQRHGGASARHSRPPIRAPASAGPVHSP